MRKITLTILTLISISLLQSCCTWGKSQNGISHTSTSVEHIVLVWLKKGYTEKDLQVVIKESKALRAIPGIIDMKLGRPLPSERAIVDDSFQLGIIMSFESAVKMNEYLTHPDHVRRVKETLKPMSSKIAVYDIVPE